MGRAIVAARTVAAGAAALCQWEAGDKLLPAPNVFTIQVADTAHVEVSEPMRYTAHSCAPNTRVTWNWGRAGGAAIAVTLVALRDIQEGTCIYLRSGAPRGLTKSCAWIFGTRMCAVVVWYCRSYFPAARRRAHHLRGGQFCGAAACASAGNITPPATMPRSISRMNA
jgi:hypothetical protein